MAVDIRCFEPRCGLDGIDGHPDFDVGADGGLGLDAVGAGEVWVVVQEVEVALAVGLGEVAIGEIEVDARLKIVRVVGLQVGQVADQSGHQVVVSEALPEFCIGELNLRGAVWPVGDDGPRPEGLCVHFEGEIMLP